MVDVIDEVRSWAREVWESATNDRSRQRVNDPLTRVDSLLQFAPASRGEPMVVAYPCTGALLTTHAVLDVPYRSRNGTVHVVCPVGPRHGGMENYIENVAEQIRRVDPAAAALIMAWPDAEESGQYGELLTGLSRAHHVRVTFDRLNHGAAETRTDGITGGSRYSEPRFGYEEPGDVVARAVFGETSPFPTTYGDVETVLARAPQLVAAVAEIEEGWETERAGLQLLADAEAEKKPSKYTVLLDVEDAVMWDQLAIALRQELGRKVDKSSIVRALVSLADESDDVRRQLVATLDRAGTPAPASVD